MPGPPCATIEAKTAAADEVGAITAKRLLPIQGYRHRPIKAATRACTGGTPAIDEYATLSGNKRLATDRPATRLSNSERAESFSMGASGGVNKGF